MTNSKKNTSSGKKTSNALTVVKPKTTTKKTKALVSVDEAINEYDFDKLYNMDEKEVSKVHEHDEKKKGKKVQLLGQISGAEMEIASLKKEYMKSLTDPTKDSVKLDIKMKALYHEIQVATAIHDKLFGPIIKR